jgi:hypothetical protein
MRTVIGFVAAGVIAASASMSGLGQKIPAADVATRMSGTWTINRELTPTFAAPGRSSVPRPRGGGVTQGALFQRAPTYPQGVRANPTNTEPTPSGVADMTPAELAEWRGMRQIQQVAPTIAIAATADHVSIGDDRGEQSCRSDGKTDRVRMFGVYMDVKCKWDKDRLRQEFSTTRSKLARTWSLDEAGHLVLKAMVEGIAQNSPETTTVYNRS